MQLLLDKGANLNAEADTEWTPLIGAASFGHLEVVKLLLAKGAEVEAGKNHLTALTGAAGSGHLEVVKQLLARNPDVDAKDRNGNTALMCAAGNGHLEVLKLLLKKGADVNATAKYGSTALIEAAAKYYGQEPGPSLKQWIPGYLALDD